jgi:hypothetical protein
MINALIFGKNFSDRTIFALRVKSRSGSEFVSDEFRTYQAMMLNFHAFF